MLSLVALSETNTGAYYRFLQDRSVTMGGGIQGEGAKQAKAISEQAGNSNAPVLPSVWGGYAVVAIEQKQWIRSPGYDLFFFCAFWWLPLSLLLFGATPTAGTALVFLLYHVFIRVPHFAATLNFTYLYKDNRPYYRGNWIKYFVLPILILAAYGVRPWFDPNSLYSSILMTVATVWGMQHIGLQNYGILSLYRGRSAARADTLLPKIERAVFYELIALAVFAEVLRLLLPGVGLDSVLRGIAWGLRGLFVLTCAAYFARIWTHLEIFQPSQSRRDPSAAETSHAGSARQHTGMTCADCNCGPSGMQAQLRQSRRPQWVTEGGISAPYASVQT